MKKDRFYKYIFIHNVSKARLTFSCHESKMATILATMITNAGDWYMKKIRPK